MDLKIIKLLILTIGLLGCKNSVEKVNVVRSDLNENHYAKYKFAKSMTEELKDTFEEDSLLVNLNHHELRMYASFGWLPPILIKINLEEDPIVTYRYFGKENYLERGSFETEIINMAPNDISIFRQKFEKLGFMKLYPIDTPSYSTFDNTKFILEYSVNGKYRMIARLDEIDQKIKDFCYYLLDYVNHTAYE